MNEKPLTVKYDEFRDVLTVNGLDYSGMLFRAMAGEKEGVGFRLNEPITMVERRDGVLTLSLYKGGWWAWRALGKAIWRFIKRNTPGIGNEGVEGILAMQQDGCFPPCLGCGYCCKKVPCGLAFREFGQITKCPALRWDGHRYVCDLAKDHGEELAIGADCCSSLNSDRRKLLDKRASGVIRR